MEGTTSMENPFKPYQLLLIPIIKASKYIFISLFTYVLLVVVITKHLSTQEVNGTALIGILIILLITQSYHFTYQMTLFSSSFANSTKMFMLRYRGCQGFRQETNQCVESSDIKDVINNYRSDEIKMISHLF